MTCHDASLQHDVAGVGGVRPPWSMVCRHTVDVIFSDFSHISRNIRNFYNMCKVDLKPFARPIEVSMLSGVIAAAVLEIFQIFDFPCFLLTK